MAAVAALGKACSAVAGNRFAYNLSIEHFGTGIPVIVAKLVQLGIARLIDMLLDRRGPTSVGTPHLEGHRRQSRGPPAKAT